MESGGHGFLEFGTVRGADAGDDVFALGMMRNRRRKLSHRGRISGKGDAGTGVFAGVAIDHGLHVDGGSPFRGDMYLLAINDCAVRSSTNRKTAPVEAPELLPRVCEILCPCVP